jgi:hypothetical protein
MPGGAFQPTLLLKEVTIQFDRGATRVTWFVLPTLTVYILRCCLSIRGNRTHTYVEFAALKAEGIHCWRDVSPIPSPRTRGSIGRDLHGISSVSPKMPTCLINALTGQMGSGTQVTGYPT